MAQPSVNTIIQRIIAAGEQYGSNTPGARETLVDLGHELSMALEIPSEFIQRSMWAEVDMILHPTTADPTLEMLTHPCCSPVYRPSTVWL